MGDRIRTVDLRNEAAALIPHDADFGRGIRRREMGGKLRGSLNIESREELETKMWYGIIHCAVRHLHSLIFLVSRAGRSHPFPDLPSSEAVPPTALVVLSLSIYSTRQPHLPF